MEPQKVKSAELEALADCNYKYGIDPNQIDPLSVEIMRNPDGTPLLDHHDRVIPISKILATKPLKRDLLTRPGPGGKTIAYMSGESVTRTLNEVFGFDGWCLEIKNTNREECIKDDKDRYHVSYTASVRVTHRKSGTFKEDCGAGDAIDRHIGTAVSHALKSAVTDALKRAARHFGDKLGNSLYEKGFGLNRAPGTLEKALDAYEIDQKLSKFGFAKDRVAVKSEPTSDPSPPSDGKFYQPEPVQSNTSANHGQKCNPPATKSTVINNYNRRHSTGNITPPVPPKQDNPQGNTSSMHNIPPSNSQDNSSSAQRPQSGHNLPNPSNCSTLVRPENKYTSKATPNNLARFAAGTTSGAQSNANISSTCTPTNSAHVLQESTNSQTKQVKRPSPAVISAPESKKPSLPSSIPQTRNPYGKASGY
uniref:Uncharacterized protein n=1 Tax=Leptocylindrus danicus TaxID=163516 RepID=A0A7S2JSB0_9STRA